MTSRIYWFGLGLVTSLIGTGAVFLAFHSWSATHGEQRTVVADPPVVVREIQGLSELVSVKYTVQKVVGIEEQKVPFGSEKLLLFVQAEVLAGVDLSSLSAANVRNLSNHRVQIVLPPPDITHIVIDDKQTKVWDRRVTWWTPWVAPDPDLERQARLKARDEIRQAALDMRILDQARSNAESSIRSLLTALGLQPVITMSALPKSLDLRA